MRFFDVLGMAFLNLWRRKLRAFLTVLGMVIGVSSIVVMVSLGIGIREATVESFAGTGSLTTIRVDKYSSVQHDNGSYSDRRKELNKKSVTAMRKLDGVAAVMPMVTSYGILKSGNYAVDAQILGVEPELAESFGLTLSEGKMPAGKRGSTYEMVLGAWTLQSFYTVGNYRQAVDKDGNPKVKLNARMQLTFDWSNMDSSGAQPTDSEGKPREKGAFYPVSAVGVMDMNNNDFGYYCIMELDALERLAKENKAFTNYEAGKYENVMVKCASIDDVKRVKAAIDEMGYGTYSLQDAVEMAQQSTQRVQYLLGAIGGVALLVAAIGITNTMMMSIFERTKEIGIIKVLGCRMENIAGLFLTESAYVGLFGGALGLGVSFGISALLNGLLADSGMRSIIPAYLAAGAVGFSILVALLAGLYPAIRAMRLSPLAAIRNE